MIQLYLHRYIICLLHCSPLRLVFLKHEHIVILFICSHEGRLSMFVRCNQRFKLDLQLHLHLTDKPTPFLFLVHIITSSVQYSKEQKSRGKKNETLNYWECFQFKTFDCAARAPLLTNNKTTACCYSSIKRVSVNLV